jgi:histidyl-tRNA synthetase
MRFFAPKGTHDILPAGPNRSDWVQDIDKWHWLEQIVRDLCASYNYHEIRTPIFEDTDLIHRSVGEGTDIVTKETYDLETRGGDRLTLRPEGTAPVVRAFIEARLDLERPVNKLYYVTPILRHEAQQAGRYRQHHQFGVEALGATGPDIDAEVIAIAMAFFTRIGIPRLTLKINSVGTPESRARYVQELRGFAEPLLPQMSEDNRRRFRQNALRMLDSKDARDQELLTGAPLLIDFLDDMEREHFEGLQNHLTRLGVDYEVDPHLVRGFDYYTLTAFEVQSPDVGSQTALAGGGRYDRLAEQLGGEPIPGIGFGLGLERALLALQHTGALIPPPPGLNAFLCPLGQRARAACVTMLEQLRAANLRADMDYTGRRMGEMLSQADEARARYAVIIGDDEIEKGVATVRDMRAPEERDERGKVKRKPQVEVPIAHLAEALRGPLGG